MKNTLILSFFIHIRKSSGRVECGFGERDSCSDHEGERRPLWREKPWTRTTVLCLRRGRTQPCHWVIDSSSRNLLWWHCGSDAGYASPNDLRFIHWQTRQLKRRWHGLTDIDKTGFSVLAGRTYQLDSQLHSVEYGRTYRQRKCRKVSIAHYKG